MVQTHQKTTNGTAGYLVGVLSWLIPGAGHWLLGLRARGVIIFCAVCATFLLGTILGSVEVIDPHHARAWFCAQIQCGLPAIIATLLQNPNIGITDISGRGVDFGQVYAGVAGLLNVLCILDALTRCQAAMSRNKPRKD